MLYTISIDIYTEDFLYSCLTIYKLSKSNLKRKITFVIKI